MPFFCGSLVESCSRGASNNVNSPVWTKTHRHGGGTPARSSSKEVRSARIEELEMLFYFEVLFLGFLDSSVAVASLSASLGSAYNLSEFISFSIGCSL
ncbi:hypothetical protein POTOM_035725 [Populus tomentosa]|uniref:Uncharacterized protein n=1 Tax=Populus tomentosa TaxID=118781 RepID=A0A8X7YUR2_POPTO|nr:hypothetical protein POTOM_035725 [Populus tomentosa]